MSGWDNAGKFVGAETYAGWASLLDENPKILWSLIADVVKAVKAGEGEKRTGRRPAASVRSLDELYAVLFPAAYGTKPFPEAFAQAMKDKGCSQYRFARDVGFNQSHISRLLSGQAAASPELMERIAGALGVPATYFVEYRAHKIGQVVTDVLLANPELSITHARNLSGARP